MPKRAGGLDRLGKVDFTRSQIVKLRTQDLVTQATAIRELATVAGRGNRMPISAG